MKKVNEIMLRRQNKLILEKSKPGNKLDKAVLITILKNIEPIGYMLSSNVLKVLQTYSMDEIAVFYKDLAKELKILIGANKKWNPMYPNFPAQVMEASDVELFVNAMIHYLGDWIGVRIMPKYKKEKRSSLSEDCKLRVIDLATEKEFHEMFQNLMESKTSISETDEEDLKWYLGECEAKVPIIVHKEILSFVYATLLNYREVNYTEAAKNFKTATDVLRLAVGLSDGDVSLSTSTKFRNFKRKERRFLLGILESCNSDIVEDMLKHKNVWIKLGEKLHPGEYGKNFPVVINAFDVLRNNKKHFTFASSLESFLEKHQIKEAVKLLKNRPGDFARRLDHLLRISKTPKAIVSEFDEIAEKVSSPVLLQVMTHFKYRNDKRDLRVFMPKGNISKIQAIENEVPDLSKSICDTVCMVCAKVLKKQYSKLSKLGKVYIDPALKDYIVPFSQRSASKAIRTVTRGSKITIPDGDTLRFFAWWKDIPDDNTNIDDNYWGGRVDIDLSAIMYNDKWTQMERISYTNLRSAKYKACHSGDITSAPNGACEFIDIDIPSILNYGGRYVVMCVLSFTRQSFSQMPESFCGWMIRKHPQSGEVFEPKTVQDKLDINTDSKLNIPVIFDLKERKMIYTDLALTSVPYRSINIENNMDALGLMGRSIEDLRKPSLYDLFTLHAESRGKIIKTRKNADIVFSLNEGITPFDIEEIVGKYI